MKDAKGFIEKYRPTDLTQVVGQEKAVKELTKRIAEGTLRQNILFSGPSGVGKSTLAKILAKTINCKQPLVIKHEGVEHFAPCNSCTPCKAGDSETSTGDFHFFDGSELGKDKVLEIKELCLSPPMYGKARIIYIDEIQNIGSGRDASLQALLKLIEHDYKGNVFFIMSTMDLKKINKAVVDRFSQHYKLKEVEPGDLISLAQRILTREGLLDGVDFENLGKYDTGIPVFIREGLTVIAASSHGCVREFVNNLETCIYRELYTEKDIQEELNLITPFKAVALIKLLLKKDKSFFNAINDFEYSMEEFFTLSFSILSDLASYMLSGETRFEWQKGQFAPFKNYVQEAYELIEAYLKAQSVMTGYFKSQVYLSAIILYMRNQIKAEVPTPSEEPPVRRRRGTP